MNLPTDHRTAPQASDAGRRDGEELIIFLEPDQLVSDRSTALPPARLSGRAKTGLWLLRIFATIVTLMVICTFISQLH